MHRLLRAFPLLTGLGLILVLAAASCGKLPLLAPTGTVINLTITSDSAALNSSVDIIAVLIENGQQSGGTGTGTAATGTSVTGAGTPVQNGTVVSFTTSLGTIEPAEAKTENGKVNVKLKTNGESGTATITAYSGGAKSTAQIKVGATNAKTITLSASPQNLGSNGGQSTISARVDDSDGNGLSGVPVSFSTTKGALNPTTATTNSSGIATTTLTTTSAADVTATVAAVSGKVTVGVATRASLSITAVPTTASVSSPVVFAITVGTGAVLTNSTIDYIGDGISLPTKLGTLSANQSVSYLYRAPGIYTISVAGTDTVAGTDQNAVTVTASTQIVITALSGALTPEPISPIIELPVKFTVALSGVTATSAAIKDYTWNFGDTDNDGSKTNPNSTTTTGPSLSHTFPKAITYLVTVTVNTQAQSSFDVILLVTVKPAASPLQ